MDNYTSKVGTLLFTHDDAAPVFTYHIVGLLLGHPHRRWANVEQILVKQSVYWD